MLFKALIVFLLTLIPTVFSITFELSYAERKCFTEELPAATDAKGTVHVSGGAGEMSLDLFISDMRGTVYFHKQDVNSIKFSFRTAHGQPHEMKTYRFCVLNQARPHSPASPGSVRRISLDVKAVSQVTHDAFNRLIKQEHADKVYSDFFTVSSEVDSIIEQMDVLRDEEKKLSEINEQTTSMILNLSLIACIFTIATGVANFFSLKSFFKRKKIA